METALINQPFKLPHPVAGFTFFAEDQVLTADHLNQLIHYFNQAQKGNSFIFHNIIKQQTLMQKRTDQIQE